MGDHVRDFFDLKQLVNVKEKLKTGEKITAISGDTHLLFIATSFGRLLRFNLSDGQCAKLQMAQAEMIAINRIIYVPAVDSLLIMTGGVLHILNSLTFETMTTKKQVKLLQVNGSYSPNFDILYYLIVTVKNEVQLCKFEQEENTVLKKWKFNHSVLSIGYNGNTVCVLTTQMCKVYDLQAETETIAFEVQNDNGTTCICNVNDHEFLVHAMPGIAVFVDSKGNSNRPPLVYQDQTTVALIHTPFFIFVATSSNLYVFDTDSLTMKQQVQKSNAIGMLGADNSALVYSEDEIFIFSEIQWISLVEDLLSKGEYKDALAVAEERSKSDRDELAILTRNKIRCQVAVEYAKEKNYTEALGLLLSAEANPTEITQYLDNLSPSFLAEYEPAFTNFFEEYFESSRVEEWAEPYRTITGTCILKLKAIRQSCLSRTDVLSVEYQRNELLDYLCEHEFDFAHADVLFHSGQINEALSEYNEMLSNNKLAKFNATEFFKRRLPFVRAVVSNLDLIIASLATYFPSETHQFLKSTELNIDASTQIHAFENGSPERFMDLLEALFNRGRCNEEQVSLLACKYGDVLRENTFTEEEKRAIRMKMRSILLKGNFNKKILHEYLHGRDDLRIEKLLIEAQGDPERTFDVLAKEMHEYDAAEQLCIQMSRTRPELALRLLDFYNKSSVPRRTPQQIASFIRHLPKDIQFGDVLSRISGNISLSELASYMSLAMLETNGRKTESVIAVGLSERGRVTVTPEIPRIEAVKVLESSVCEVCNESFFENGVVLSLSSGYFVHEECHPHPSLCPVTNQRLSYVTKLVL